MQVEWELLSPLLSFHSGMWAALRVLLSSAVAVTPNIFRRVTTLTVSQPGLNGHLRTLGKHVTHRSAHPSWVQSQVLSLSLTFSCHPTPVSISSQQHSVPCVSEPGGPGGSGERAGTSGRWGATWKQSPINDRPSLNEGPANLGQFQRGSGNSGNPLGRVVAQGQPGRGNSQAWSGLGRSSGSVAKAQKPTVPNRGLHGAGG